MLIINRYTNPNTQQVTICVHKMKGHKIVESYTEMSEDNIRLFKGYKAMIFDVSHAHKLNKVHCVSL